MGIKFALGAVLLGCVTMVSPAKALVKGTFEKPVAGVASASVYEKTLPPIGYVEFCGRGEDECKFSGGHAEKLALTDDAWDKIKEVNHWANTKFRPATDFEVFAMADYWTYPVSAGDCEDYVLAKKRALIGLGISPQSLLITVVLDENRDGHAVLTIPTDQGDMVLDNRRTDVLRWDQTGYTFLKRQSQAQSNQWLSLQKGPTTSVLVGSKSK